MKETHQEWLLFDGSSCGPSMFTIPGLGGARPHPVPSALLEAFPEHRASLSLIHWPCSPV